MNSSNAAEKQTFSRNLRAEQLEQLNQMWVGVGRPIIGSMRQITSILTRSAGDFSGFA
jgi:hypothetical protein